jgi:hypothetical protein
MRGREREREERGAPRERGERGQVHKSKEQKGRKEENNKTQESTEWWWYARLWVHLWLWLVAGGG